jgi:hypothetical protein
VTVTATPALLFSDSIPPFALSNTPALLTKGDDDFGGVQGRALVDRWPVPWPRDSMDPVNAPLTEPGLDAGRRTLLLTSLFRSPFPDQDERTGLRELSHRERSDGL